MYKLYGVPLSQPFRSVAWALLLKRVAFEAQLVAPGSPHPKNGSRGADFRSLTRNRSNGTPALQETSSGFVVLESAAILTYLSHKHRWDDLYPRGGGNDVDNDSLLRFRATLDSYLHWHHEGTRHLAKLVQPALRPDIPQLEPEDVRRERAHEVLSQLEHGWLRGTDDENGGEEQGAPFLAGSHHPTIADILCYGEVSQAVMLGALDLEEGGGESKGNKRDYPKLRAWSGRMRRLDFHDDVHAALVALGSVAADDPSSRGNTPVSKRLGRATREGLQALQRAQERY